MFRRTRSKPEISDARPREWETRLQGWLLKKKQNKNWKKRWCMVTDSKFFYFAKDVDLLPKGVFFAEGHVYSPRRYKKRVLLFDTPRNAPNVLLQGPESKKHG
eukprot:Rmarinus@m.11461